MKRTTISALVSGALVLATAAPAAAAPPTRQSSRATFFSLSSPGCMTGKEPCRGVFALEGEDGGFVCVDLPSARGGLSGCTDTGPGTLTVTRTAQALEPTRVTAVRLECDEESEEGECRITEARTVTVSADAVTTGRRRNRVFRSHERTPECTSIASFRSRSASVAGTLTISGRRHSLTGEAGTSRERFLFRGCEGF